MSLELKLTETFHVAREQVFQAWRDPDQVRKWFGCGPGQLWTVHHWDCRPGGLLRVSMVVDEKKFNVEGEFLEVVDNERLLYRFGEEIVEVFFEECGSSTRVRLCHRELRQEDDIATRNGGWSYCLGTSLRQFLS